MKRNVFLLKGNNVIHKGKIYEIDMFLKEFKIPKQIVIYILGEDLFIHDYAINTKVHKNNVIDNILKSVFGVDEDYLFDYNLDRKNKLVNIYAVKGGHRVSKLCKNVIDVKVIPLQFEISRLSKSKVKDKNFRLIYLYSGSYYFMEFYNMKLIKSFVKDNLEDVKKIVENDSSTVIYIDNKIEELNIKNTKKIDLRRILDEKILS